jgi:hypothetical protein
MHVGEELILTSYSAGQEYLANIVNLMQISWIRYL